MRKYILIWFSLGIIACLTGCEKEMMDYEGTASIYFDVQRGAAHLDSVAWPRHYYTPINFIRIQEEALEVKLKMSFCGDVKDYDRTFKVEVVKDSTDAVEGTHFDLKREWTMPAGADAAFITITLYKNDDYLSHSRRIMLRVVPNEYFDANMTFERLAGRYDLYPEDKLYEEDPRVHNIILDYQVEKPKSWSGLDYPPGVDNPNPYEAGLYGAYTIKKYLLMLEVTGLSDEDFQDMPSSKRTVICEIMSRYLEDQFDHGDPVLEDDGRLMWFMKVTKWSSYQYEW